ncbi:MULTISPECIES: hypothetical protein [unclassified Okeania]|uniref:hypothetical protein n=1 Tax=unclassified Okeania TaxID=2634635 RepID=UPI0013B74553|nr:MULTISPECIES: hypothetical protein [unclassified Okeania]NET18815.1 hypothetical protein [Okeania sp. SIO1H5]NET76841.1 hypothetical protein [Okeania sp. SIO1F9]NET97151.1 hypothetical protein [Okeania sp. SIO1H2]
MVVSGASRRVGWRSSERVCTLRVSSPYPINQEKENSASSRFPIAGGTDNVVPL